MSTRTDGTVKDASEMDWHFDADSAAPPHLQSTHFSLVAGACRSNRPLCPSQRALDAATASTYAGPSTASDVGTKRKAR